MKIISVWFYDGYYFWHQSCIKDTELTWFREGKALEMRLRSILLGLLLGLGVCGAASAVTITVDGLTAEGMGQCFGTAPGSPFGYPTGTYKYNGFQFDDCIYAPAPNPNPTNLPNAIDPPGTTDTSGGVGDTLLWDWVILQELSFPDPVTPVVFADLMGGHFGAGQTGSIATVPRVYDFALVERFVRVIDGGVEIASQGFIQQAHLKIGLNFDSLLLDGIDVSVGGFRVTIDSFETGDVEGDPDILWDGRISQLDSTNMPLPSTLALLGLGLAGFGFRRRQTA